MNKKEIRNILLGRIVRVDEKLWAAAPADVRFHFYGAKDGAVDVRLFGVTHLSRDYQPEGVKQTAALAAAESALNSMGRPMQLVSMPEKKACLYAPGWIAPVLLTLETGKDDLKMTAYTGRSLFFGRLRCRISLWILERRLLGGITRTDKKEREGEEENSAAKTVKTEQPTEVEKSVKTVKPTQKPKRVAPRKKKSAPRRLAK